MSIAVKPVDRVSDTSTTTGTGFLTLDGAAPAGFRSFFQAYGTGNHIVPYVIDGGAEWEVGIGTFFSSNQLSRGTVLSSSDAGAAVNFSAGTKKVYVAVNSAFGLPSVRHNWTATTDPTTSDTHSQGYDYGSLWYNENTNTLWVCTGVDGVWQPAFFPSGVHGLGPAFGTRVGMFALGANYANFNTSGTYSGILGANPATSSYGLSGVGQVGAAIDGTVAGNSDAPYGFMHGLNAALTRGYEYVHGLFKHSSATRHLYRRIGLTAQTTDATATELLTYNGARLNLPSSNRAVLHFTAIVSAVDSTDGAKVWRVEGVARSTSGAGTGLVGTPTVTVVASDTNTASWALAVSHDLGNPTFTGTGAASKTILWSAVIEAHAVEAP